MSDQVNTLPDAKLKELLSNAMKEQERRKEGTKYTVMLFVEADTLTLSDLEGSVTVGDLKSIVEEEAFPIAGGKTIPGPSSKWIYKHDGSEVDEAHSICVYEEEDEINVVTFTVLPPSKKRKWAQISTPQTSSNKIGEPEPSTKKQKKDEKES